MGLLFLIQARLMRRLGIEPNHQHDGLMVTTAIMMLIVFVAFGLALVIR